jgi:hypothetical protein
MQAIEEMEKTKKEFELLTKRLEEKFSEKEKHL